MTERDAKSFFSPCREFATAHCLARLCLADFQSVLARRRCPEVMIEADHAMHIGPGQVQLVRKLPDGLFADVAVALEKGVQNLHQQLGAGAEPVDDFGCDSVVVLGCHHSNYPVFTRINIKTAIPQKAI